MRTCPYAQNVTGRRHAHYSNFCYIVDQLVFSNRIKESKELRKINSNLEKLYLRGPSTTSVSQVGSL